jgi:hypothetical protein
MLTQNFASIKVIFMLIVLLLKKKCLTFLVLVQTEIDIYFRKISILKIYFVS